MCVGEVWSDGDLEGDGGAQVRVRIDSISRERRGEVLIVVWGGWRGEAPTSGAASIVDV